VQNPNAVPGMLDTGANTAPAIYRDPSADLGQLGSSTLASKPIHSQPTMVPGVIGKAPPQL
jgi:hypothetical protein